MDNWNFLCRLCTNVKSKNKLIKIWQKKSKTDIPELIKNIVKLQIHKNDLLPDCICDECLNFLETIKEKLDFYLESDIKLRKLLAEKQTVEEIKDDPDDAIGQSSETNPLANVEAVIEHVDVKQENFEENLSKSQEQMVDFPKRSTRRKNAAKSSEEREIKQPKCKDNRSSDDEDFRQSDSPSSQSEFELEPENGKIKTKKVKRTPRRNRDQNQSKKRRIRRQYPDAPLHNDNKCYVCNTQLESATAYFEHLFVHSDMIPYTCNRCVVDKIVIKQVKSLATHFKMHVRPVKCDYCDKRFNDDKAKDFHIEYTHLNKSGKTTCEYCNQVFDSALRCTYHVNKIHLIKFPCPHCNKPFGAKDLLGTHIKRVHENRLEIFECSTCGAKLKGNESFLAHLRKMHSNDLKYKCNLCGKAYLHQSLLNHHLNLHASKPGYKFIPKRNYNEYYNIKTDEKTQNAMMECKECFELVEQDPKRMRLHASTHIKPYTCTFCGKGFSKQEECQDHENTHTGNKPHTCEFCGQNFISRYKLRTHHRNKHSEKMPFHCSKCSTAFKIEQTLKLHEKKCFTK